MQKTLAITVGVPFRMEVFEPAMLSVTVQDKRYANAIETCFNATDMKVKNA